MNNIHSLLSGLYESVQLLWQLFSVAVVLNVANWTVFGKVLYVFTIPRTWLGLIGIPLAPLLHGDWEHLLINALSFALFAALLMLKSRYLFFAVLFLIAVIEGVTVWLLSLHQSPSFGASGVVFGLFSYTVLSAVLHRDVVSIALAIAAIASHWQLFRIFTTDHQSGISSISHFAGLFGGIGVALFGG